MGEVWLFPLGLNFWNVHNFAVATNLPRINQHEHATFFTGGGTLMVPCLREGTHCICHHPLL